MRNWFSVLLVTGFLVSGGAALTWSLYGEDGKEDGAKAPLPGEEEQTTVVIYDVTDLVRPLTNFPAPKLGLSGLEEQPGAGGLVPDAGDDGEAQFTTEKLVELIREFVIDRLPEEDRKKVSIIGERGQIIVSVTGKIHHEIAGYLNSVRSPSTVEAKLIAVTDQGKKTLGLPLAATGSDEMPVDSMNAKIKFLEKEGQLSVIKSLALTAFDRQTMHMAVMGQEAYVADFEIDPKTQEADPVVEILVDGLALTVQVRKSCQAGRVRVNWNLDVARVDKPAKFVKLDPNLEVETPVVRHEIVEGSSFLSADKWAVIRGIGPADGEGREQILLLRWQPSAALSSAPASPEKTSGTPK